MNTNITNNKTNMSDLYCTKPTKEEKKRIEALIQDVLFHPFLRYTPFLQSDDTILKDAKKRANGFKAYTSNILDVLDHLCCICDIGKIEEAENPYTTEGDIVVYKYLKICFPQEESEDYLLAVNKSDFNPRRYLTIMLLNPMLILCKHIEKQCTETEKSVKISSLFNDEAEIERHSYERAIMAYSIPCISGYGAVRPALRLYSIESTDSIRKQILRTQQYYLASILTTPNIICSEDVKCNLDIFNKYRYQFEHLFASVTQEMVDKGIDSVLKENVISTFVDKEEFNNQLISDVLSDEQIEKIRYRYNCIGNYVGRYVICKSDIDEFYGENPSLYDKKGNEFLPLFKNSNEAVQQSEVYCNFDFMQIDESQNLIAIYADDIHHEYNEDDNDYNRWEDCWDDEFGRDGDFYDDKNKDEFDDEDDEFDVDLKIPEQNHYYIGILNKYGQVVYEFKSLTQIQYEFKAINDTFLIFYDNDCYDFSKNIHTRCGAINLKNGTIVAAPVFTMDDIKNRLAHGYSCQQNPHSGWVINCFNIYGMDEYYFSGPIIRKRKDRLEYGKFAGWRVEDLIFYYPNYILQQVLDNKIFIADSFFSKNRFRLSWTEKLIRRHQEKKLRFDSINCIDDAIATTNGFNDGTKFCSLYEGKTLREIVYDYKDIDYIVSLTDSGVININKKNLEEAINEGYLEFSKILDSIESYEAEKMEREEWE
jgi:hypothetical protein